MAAMTKNGTTKEAKAPGAAIIMTMPLDKNGKPLKGKAKANALAKMALAARAAEAAKKAAKLAAKAPKAKKAATKKAKTPKAKPEGKNPNFTAGALKAWATRKANKAAAEAAAAATA